MVKVHKKCYLNHTLHEPGAIVKWEGHIAKWMEVLPEKKEEEKKEPKK